MARTVASAPLTEALGQARLVTVHAGDPAAKRFWKAMGFAPIADRPWSHQLAAH